MSMHCNDLAQLDYIFAMKIKPKNYDKRRINLPEKQRTKKKI